MPRARLPRLPALLLLLGILPLAVAIVPKAIALFPPSDMGVQDKAASRSPAVASRAPAAAFVRVIDGDSLRADGKEIRLIGIDAPELFQTCRDAQAREWPCGQAAKARLIELVSGGNVACTARGHDRYGRTLAVCSAGKIADIGETLVSEGYAVNYAIDYGGYPAAERAAQTARRGLWQGRFDRPQDWRRSHRRSSYVR